MKEIRLTKVPFTAVKIEDIFWGKRLKQHQERTLKSCLNQCEETGRIANFEKAAKDEGDFEGVLFNDSDIYKIIEGIGYSLMNNPNQGLESYTDLIIDKIEKAQEEDGYLDTYFRLGRKNEKWTDMMAHEAYCAGHFIEAAVSYFAATGKRKILDIAIKLADHLVATFGKGERHFTVGHQEIELALLKLYDVTKNKAYFELAEWFIEERGHHYGFVDIAWNRDSMGGEAYNQDDKPIRELSDINGHAVRAMYYFCAVADLAAINGDKGYMAAMDRLWESTVLRNMYITGGIGSSHTNEGFSGDYDLPNDEAYCETCASIGMVYWNNRMNLMKKDAKYVDVIEKEIYNGAISGLSLDGQKFFYVNPLETDGTHHRESWYGVSCCPTQLARFVPSIGDYVYAVNTEGVYVNLYLENTATIPFKNQELIIKQKTNYPWCGKISFEIHSTIGESYPLYFRYPEWAKGVSVLYNGESLSIEHIDGYIKIENNWNSGDSVMLDFPMPVEKIYSNEKVQVNRGKVALQRGPIVYCFEEVDQHNNYDDICINEKSKFETRYEKGLLEGIVKVKVQTDGRTYTAIPYYAWDNRSPGKMKVWVDEKITNSHEALYAYKF